MAEVTKTARVAAIKDRGQLTVTDPTTNLPVQVAAIELTVVLGEGTPAEQKPTFMIFESDYVALGSPPYGATVDISITYPAA